MIIKKKRVIKLNFLDNIMKGEKIQFGVFLDRDKKIIAKKIGFSEKLEEGETILPMSIGPVSKRNSEGEYIPLKDKEKEIVYYKRLWKWKQWAGRGETVEKEKMVYIPVERYKREFIPPQNIEFFIKIKDKQKYILTKEFIFEDKNFKIIKHTINLILELFGECEIFNKSINSLEENQIKRLDWDILPKGEYPWIKLSKSVNKIIKNVRRGNKIIIKDRIEHINSFNPDFIAFGRAGFYGYIVFGFENKNLYILESIYTYNATYVFENDWKKFSKLSKAEILNNQYQKQRVIHKKGWEKSIENLLKV